MLTDQTALAIIGATSQDDFTATHSADDGEPVRDIHPLTQPQQQPNGRRGEAWETSSHRSVSTSAASDGGSSENFTTMSREFNALVLAGAEIGRVGYINEDDGGNNRASLLARIREDNPPEEETNPLAIVPDTNPMNSAPTTRRNPGFLAEITLQRVKKEEVETKITAWQNAKIAKVNNRFKREEAVIRGWEGEQVQKSTSWMKKVERKLEEKRARAMEKMENEMANARRKAEERRASSEGKRGIKVAKIQEIAHFMRALGRAPSKKSFF